MKMRPQYFESGIQDNHNLMDELKERGMMRCSKCAHELRSIGFDQDEFGIFEGFVCDWCTDPKRNFS